MAPVERHGVLEHVLSLGSSLVSRVNHPSVGLHENGGTKVLLLVPPVRRTRGRAAGTQNALVETVELSSVVNGLEVLLSVGRDLVSLEVGLDGLVLLVELGEVGDKVSDDKHVGQGVDLLLLGDVGVDSTEACESVSALNVHGARAADTFSARPSEGEGGVLLVLDLDERVEDHGTALAEVDLVLLELGLLFGGVRVPSVDAKLLDSGGRDGGGVGGRSQASCEHVLGLEGVS